MIGFLKSIFSKDAYAGPEAPPSLSEYVDDTARQIANINIADYIQRERDGLPPSKAHRYTDRTALENHILRVGFHIAGKQEIGKEEGVLKSCDMLREIYGIGVKNVVCRQGEADSLVFKGMEIL